MKHFTTSRTSYWN